MELYAQPNNDNGENSNPDPIPDNGETGATHEPAEHEFEDFDSTCSTPYVSAPSSPGRGPGPNSGFFYSAPASPMHFAVTKAFNSTSHHQHCSSSSAMENYSLTSEFEFAARFGPNGSGSTGSMSSADELFLNGQIRPMKLSTHLEQPLPPLLDLDVEDNDEYEGGKIIGYVRGRDLRLRDKSLRRRTRSMSPLRDVHNEWAENEDVDEKQKENMEESERMEKIVGALGNNNNNSEATTPSVSASTSRSSSAGRSSKRWVFLKEFLYRSKSEGRSNNNFWSTISFSPIKEKKSANSKSVTKQKFMNSLMGSSSSTSSSEAAEKVLEKETVSGKKNVAAGKPANGVGKRRIPPSPHELHYTANRAQAEEMRKKTFLPYRQGLLGCLGFSSKGYGAVKGFARALNPVSSR